MVEFQFGDTLIEMKNTEKEGRAVLLRFLRHFPCSDNRFDKELERLHKKYFDMLTRSDADYPRRFAMGALKLIEEIDSADGTLPDF